MASYSLPDIACISGTYKVTLIADIAGLTVPSGNTIVSLGDLEEIPEEGFGIFQASTLQALIQDDYTTYPQGFWYKVFAEGTDVELKVLRTEGGSDVYYFWGYTKKQQVEWKEYTNIDVDADGDPDTLIRQASVTFVSMLGKVQESSLTDVLTEFYTHESATVQPTVTGLTVTPVGANDGQTYGYQVRAVFGTIRSEKNAQVTTAAGATTLGGGNSITVQWTAVEGATAYDVYRTIGGALYGTGYLASVSSPTVTYSDTGGGATDPDPHTSNNAKFATLTALIASISKVAWGQTYDVTDAEFVTNSANDFAFTYASTAYAVNEVSILTELAGARSAYFNSANDDYWPERFNPLTLLGSLCRNFGLLARYYYDTTNSRHRIQLLTRGTAFSGTVTMDGNFDESTIWMVNDFVIRGVRAYDATDATAAFEVTNINNETDFEIPCEFALVNGNGVNAVYVLAGSANVHPTDVSYYNYSTGLYTTETETYEFLAALVNYYYQRFTTYGRTIERNYHDLNATLSGASSHLNITPFRKTTIHDGSSSATYIAYGVVKRAESDSVMVRWVES